AFLDDTAKAKRMTLGCLVRVDFRWRVQISHVLLQGEHRQAGRDRDRAEDQQRDDQAPLANRVHVDASARAARVLRVRSRASRPRSSRVKRRRRSAGANQSHTSTMKNTANAGQTYMA